MSTWKSFWSVLWDASGYLSCRSYSKVITENMFKYVLSAFVDTHHNYSDINTVSRVLTNALLNAKCCLLETLKLDTRLSCQHSTAIHGKFKNRNTLKWTVNEFFNRERVEKRIRRGIHEVSVDKGKNRKQTFQSKSKTFKRKKCWNCLLMTWCCKFVNNFPFAVRFFKEFPRNLETRSREILRLTLFRVQRKFFHTHKQFFASFDSTIENSRVALSEVSSFSTSMNVSARFHLNRFFYSLNFKQGWLQNFNKNLSPR